MTVRWYTDLSSLQRKQTKKINNKKVILFSIVEDDSQLFVRVTWQISWPVFVISMTVKLLVKLAFSRWKTQGGAATSQLMTDNTDNTDNTDACLLQETDEDISVFIIGERVTFSRSRQLSTWANVYPVLISTELDYLLITKWRAGWVSIPGKTRIREHCPVEKSKKSIHRLDSLFETPVCLQCRASSRPSWVYTSSRKWKPGFDKRPAVGKPLVKCMKYFHHHRRRAYIAHKYC